MTDNSFLDEVTPVLGETTDINKAASVISSATINSWEEEKTILLDDDVSEEAKVWLLNLDSNIVVEIKSYPFTIGRTADADLSTQHSSVSRKHAIINKTEDGSRFVIEDLGSSNGIKVNGFKTPKVILSNQDEITIGNMKFSFHIAEHEEQAETALNTTPNKKTLPEILSAYKQTANFNKKKFYGLIGATLLALTSIYYFTVGSRVQTVTSPKTDNSVIKVVTQAEEPAPETEMVAKEEKKSEDILAVDNQEKPVSQVTDEIARADVNATELQNTESEVNSDLVTHTQDNQQKTTVPLEQNTVTAQALVTVTAAQVEPPLKKVIRRSPAWSENYIQESLNMYLAGDATTSIKRLGILSRSARHQQKYRSQSATLANQLESLIQKYQLGKSLSQQGNRNAAFSTWQSFLVSENSLFPNKSSVYTADIQAEVAVEYTASGNRARLEGRSHDAYSSWQKASTVLPSGEAARSLADLKAQAKKVYLDAYLKEKVNIQSATILWREVISLVPPGNEYHTKAKAKLRLYENYGAK